MGLIVYLIMLFNLSCSCIYKVEDIYGLWKGNNNNNEIVLKFMSGGKCSLIISDITLSTAKSYDGNFEINFSKKPIPISINNIQQYDSSLYTILEFIGENEIKIEKFSDRWKLRPVSFNNQTAITLKRVIL